MTPTMESKRRKKLNENVDKSENQQNNSYENRCICIMLWSIQNIKIYYLSLNRALRS